MSVTGRTAAVGKTNFVPGNAAAKLLAASAQPAPVSPRPCSQITVLLCGAVGFTTIGGRAGV